MSTHRLTLRLFLAVGLLLLAACGGGSGTPADDEEDPGVIPPPEPERVDLVSDPTRDGWVQSIGGTSLNTLLRAGDSVGVNGTYAAFLAIELAEAPPIASIVKATLLVHQVQVYGTPYASLGTLDVFQVDIGVGLDQTDLTAPVIATVGTLATSPAVATYALDVTTLLKSNLSAGRARLDLRLEFPTLTDGDGQDDYVELNDGADTASAGTPSKIVVEYR